jgi:hypothetical protein
MNGAHKRSYYDKIKSDIGQQKWVNTNHSAVRHIPHTSAMILRNKRSTTSFEGRWHWTVTQRQLKKGPYQCWQDGSIGKDLCHQDWQPVISPWAPPDGRVNWSLQVVFWPLHMCNDLCVCMCGVCVYVCVHACVHMCAVLGNNHHLMSVSNSLVSQSSFSSICMCTYIKNNVKRVWWLLSVILDIRRLRPHTHTHTHTHTLEGRRRMDESSDPTHKRSCSMLLEQSAMNLTKGYLLWNTVVDDFVLCLRHEYTNQDKSDPGMTYLFHSLLSREWKTLFQVIHSFRSALSTLTDGIILVSLLLRQLKYQWDISLLASDFLLK